MTLLSSDQCHKRLGSSREILLSGSSDSPLLVLSSASCSLLDVVKCAIEIEPTADDTVGKYRAEGVEWVIQTPKLQVGAFRWPIQHPKFCISQLSLSISYFTI